MGPGHCCLWGLSRAPHTAHYVHRGKASACGLGCSDQQCLLVSLAAPLWRRALDSESWGQALHQLPLA